MRAVRTIEGTAVPLDRSDVDTDQIIPSDWLKQVERTGFEKGLFSEWRDDPAFVLHQEQFQGANVLIGGPNFGTGSSREHAVWALTGYGVRVVVSSRFADIFRGNSSKAGLLAAQVTQDDVELLWKRLESEPGAEITVDLESKQITCGDLVCPFEVDDYTRWRLLEGLDDIGLTLRHVDAIDAFEASRPAHKPATVLD